jgi:hypothetical protein
MPAPRARRLVAAAFLPAFGALALQWTLPWRLVAIGWRPYFVEWWPNGFIATLFATLFTIGVTLAGLANVRTRPRRAAVYVAIAGVLPLLARFFARYGGPRADLARLDDAPVRWALAACSVVAAVLIARRARAVA